VEDHRRIWPTAVAFSPGGAKAYVTNSGSGTITPITVATYQAGKQVNVSAGAAFGAAYPDALAIMP
jgi:YVTN family beta-propeller protein